MPDEPRPDRLDPEVLGRYLTGTCTAAEREMVARMCAEHPDVTQRLAVYLSLLDGETTRPAPPETDASWATLRARIREASEARPSLNTVTAAARQVVLRPQLGTYQRNVDYFALAHASEFVRPGASRIGSTSDVAGLQSTAFQNADDGSKVLIVLNTGTAEPSFAAVWRGGTVSYSLPASSVLTVVWK